MARLTVLSGAQEGLQVELDSDQTTLGRASDNTVPILSTTISSHHCLVMREDSKFTLKDTRSTNGTILNGVRIREARLRPGDIFTVGGIDIRFDGADVDVGDMPPELARGPSDTVMVLTHAEPQDIPASFAVRRKSRTKWIVVAIAAAAVATLGLLVWFLVRLFSPG